MIRVCVADDHAVVREGLQRILEAVEDMEFAGACSNVQELLANAAEERWDVVVLDLSGLGGDAASTIASLRAASSSIRVIVYSMYPEEQYGVAMLKAGASAYLSKGRSTQVLLEAIRRAATGRRFVTTEIADRLLEGSDGGIDALSDRERQVLRLAAEGQGTNAIAKTLSLSPSTVSTHLSNIKDKLGVRSVAELVRYAVRAGLVV